MSQIIQTQKGKKKSSFIEFLKKECVLVIAVTLAILSSFISIPKLSYIDFKVLILLFNLMVVVAAFKELKVLDSIAIGLLKKCNTYTSISLALVFITFISSMIVTNDVALITFVPLSIVIARKANINVLKIVVFQTLAANLGSSFTPMGNPQNLFIFTKVSQTSKISLRHQVSTPTVLLLKMPNSSKSGESLPLNLRHNMCLAKTALSWILSLKMGTPSRTVTILP